MTPDQGYPKPISHGFQGIPNNVDTAFVWSGNDKIYFFKGANYWRFDPEHSPPVKGSYPRPIINWDGLPDNLSSAMQYKNGFTYFFKGNKYWRFNDRQFSVSFVNKSYPLNPLFEYRGRGWVQKSGWVQKCGRRSISTRESNWIFNSVH